MVFEWRWLRRFVRRHTHPIPEVRAGLWKGRLSVAYMLLAWNAFGFVCYMVYTGRGDWAKYYGYKSEEEASMSPAEYYAKLFNQDKAKIIRISGLTKVEEMDYDKTAEKESETKST